MVGTGSAMVYVKMASSAFLDQESMEDSLQSSNAVPQWYIVVTSEQKIIAGAGVIANDFYLLFCQKSRMLGQHQLKASHV